jgi:hypothetical protein
MTPSNVEDDRARTLFFLTHSKHWPHWPFLPVVRRRPGCEEELGVVFDSLNAGGPAGYTCTVLFSNLYLLPHRLDQLLNLPRETFDTAEEVADAGWSVD